MIKEVGDVDERKEDKKPEDREPRGGQPQEPVEDRPNVGSTKPEQYPEEERAKG